ncbi:MAG: hypothetical protein IPK97_04575 [Ahniella sp.]|nr:hypothetical protein [Ahniella sp.]
MLLSLLVAGLSMSTSSTAVELKTGQDQQIDPVWIQLSARDYTFPVERFLDHAEHAKHIYLIERAVDSGTEAHHTVWQVRQHVQSLLCQTTDCPSPEWQLIQAHLAQTNAKTDEPNEPSSGRFMIVFWHEGVLSQLKVGADQQRSASLLVTAFGHIHAPELRRWILTPRSPSPANVADSHDPELRSVERALDFDAAMDQEQSRVLATALREGNTEGIRHSGLSTAICTAAINGWVDGLEVLLDHDGALVDSNCAPGVTPLGLSQRFGHESAIRLLVTRGARSLGSMAGPNVVPFATPQTFRFTVRTYLELPSQSRSAICAAPPEAAIQSLRWFGPVDLKFIKRVRRECPQLFHQAFANDPESASLALSRAAELDQPDAYDFLLEQGLPETDQPKSGPNLAPWYRKRFGITNPHSTPER